MATAEDSLFQGGMAALRRVVQDVCILDTQGAATPLPRDCAWVSHVPSENTHTAMKTLMHLMDQGNSAAMLHALNGLSLPQRALDALLDALADRVQAMCAAPRGTALPPVAWFDVLRWVFQWASGPARTAFVWRVLLMRTPPGLGAPGDVCQQLMGVFIMPHHAALTQLCMEARSAFPQCIMGVSCPAHHQAALVRHALRWGCVEQALCLHLNVVPVVGPTALTTAIATATGQPVDTWLYAALRRSCKKKDTPQPSLPVHVYRDETLQCAAAAGNVAVVRALLETLPGSPETSIADALATCGSLCPPTSTRAWRECFVFLAEKCRRGAQARAMWVLMHRCPAPRLEDWAFCAQQLMVCLEFVDCAAARPDTPDPVEAAVDWTVLPYVVRYAARHAMLDVLQRALGMVRTVHENMSRTGAVAGSSLHEWETSAADARTPEETRRMHHGAAACGNANGTTTQLHASERMPPVGRVAQDALHAFVRHVLDGRSVSPLHGSVCAVLCQHGADLRSKEGLTALLWQPGAAPTSAPFRRAMLGVVQDMWDTLLCYGDGGLDEDALPAGDVALARTRQHAATRRRQRRSSRKRRSGNDASAHASKRARAETMQV